MASYNDVTQLFSWILLLFLKRASKVPDYFLPHFVYKMSIRGCIIEGKSRVFGNHLIEPSPIYT